MVLTALATAAWSRRRYRHRQRLRLDQQAMQLRQQANQRPQGVHFPAGDASRLQVYTVATTPGPGLDQLRASCHRADLGLTVLGLGNQWEGYGNKWLWTLAYLKSQDLPPDALMVFVDGYDVINTARPEELIAKFRQFNACVVFSAEVNCYPDEALAAQYPPSPTRFRYLNSGAAMGHVGDFIRIIERVGFGVTDDDQRRFTRYFLDHPGEITLDHQSQLFASLFRLGMEDFEWDAAQQRFILVETGTQPCFLHGNGTSAPLLQAMAQRLSLELQ